MRKTFATIIATMVVISLLSGCGDKPVSQTGENIIENTTGEGNKFEVQLDERTEETKYEYGEDDLSLVDTMSGKKITLGMSQAEIQEITGESEQTDRDVLIYDGVMVKYKDGVAVSFMVSNGKFKEGKEKRYKTTRGVGIGTTAEDFAKAYGDGYPGGDDTTDESGDTFKVAAGAVRYFKKDGRKIEFLGTEPPSEEENAEYYIQDFMFSNKTGNIATLRISLTSAAKGGM